MKGLFDTAKNMAVFMRVLLLTFALQCIFGAVGYAQENPTGGDQGAPSCSSGECTSGDSCACLTTHFLNNDGDEFCADSNPTQDDSNEYELEEVTNDEQREELLKRLTEAQSKGEQGVSDGAVHYIFVDQYLKTPKEVYEEKLEQATPGERWLIERMTENYKSLRGGKNEFPTSVNTGIALEQMLPQVIPRYHPNGFELAKTITRLSKLDYSDEIYSRFDVYERDGAYRNWWALKLGDQHTCYYNGYWTRQGTAGWDTFRPLDREDEDEVKKFPLLRLFKCINNEFLKEESLEKKLETILNIKSQWHNEAVMNLEFVVSLVPGAGTALLVQDNWDELRAGDCTAWGYFLGSAAGEVFLIGKGTAFVRALRVANKAKEVGKGWRIASIVTGTAGVGLVGRPLLAKARKGDFGVTEWGELTQVGIELVFLVLDIKAEIPKNTRIFRQKVPSSAVGCAEATPLKCDAPDANRPTWKGVPDDAILPSDPNRKGIDPIFLLDKKTQKDWKRYGTQTKGRNRKKFIEQFVDKDLEKKFDRTKGQVSVVGLYYYLQEKAEIQVKALARAWTVNEILTLGIRNKQRIIADTDKSIVVDLEKVLCGAEHGWNKLDGVWDELGHPPTALSVVAIRNKNTGEIVTTSFAVNGRPNAVAHEDVKMLWGGKTPQKDRPFDNCAEPNAIEAAFLQVENERKIFLDRDWHREHEIYVYTVRMERQKIVSVRLSGSELEESLMIPNGQSSPMNRCVNCKQWCEEDNGMAILTESPWADVLTEKMEAVGKAKLFRELPDQLQEEVLLMGGQL